MTCTPYYDTRLHDIKTVYRVAQPTSNTLFCTVFYYTLHLNVSKLGMPIRSCAPRSAGEYDISPKSGSGCRPTNGIIVPQFGKKESECSPLTSWTNPAFGSGASTYFSACLSFDFPFLSFSII